MASEPDRQPLLALVIKGCDAPTAETLAMRKDPYGPSDAENPLVDWVRQQPESVAVLGIVYEQLDGYLVFESSSGDVNVQKKGEEFVAGCNKSNPDGPDDEWTPRGIALQIAHSTGNQAYSNPSWRPIEPSGAPADFTVHAYTSAPRKTRLETAFGRSRVFLPVIHPVARDTALESIRTAIESEADGIFLINQGMSSSQVLHFIQEVRRRHHDLWIGVNLLGTEPEEVIGLVADLPVGGIWSDNADIDEQSESQPAGERFQQAREKVGWQGLYFGGVAFKYQREVPDALLPAAGRHAVPWMDVVTSSGPGTGYAASVEKARALRSGMGIHPLALASGVSPENVAGFLPYVDAYLVASEIETAKYSGILVPERTKLLSERIHSWNNDGAEPADAGDA